MAYPEVKEVFPLAERVISDTHLLSECYLSDCLRRFVPAGKNNRWPGLLSVLDCPGLVISPREVALIGASHEIPQSISRYMAECISEDILPAIARHQSVFDCDKALVHIAGPKELEAMWREERKAVFPDDIIKIDLNLIRQILGEKYASLGANLERSTLCVVKVGDTYHNLLAASGGLPYQQTSTAEFKEWAKDVKRRFNVDLRFTYKSSARETIPVRLSGDESKIASISQKEVLLKLPSEVSRGKFPETLKHVTEDWTDDIFVSIDDAGALAREDILSARYLPDNSIRVRIAIPFSAPYDATGHQTFALREKTFSLGQEFVISEDGKVAECKILPVITRNSAELDSATTSIVLGRLYKRNQSGLASSIPPPSLEVADIEGNTDIFQTIIALQSAASRITKMRLNLGTTVEIPLGRTTADDMRADTVAGIILSHGQQLLTEWILYKHPHVPLIVLRPTYKFGESFRRLVEDRPWITEDHLQNLDKRRSLVEILSFRKDEEGLKLLGEALKTSICTHRIVAVENINDMQEEDMTRFKRSHRKVLGQVGHTQVNSIFFGTPRYTFKQLEAYAQILNLPPEEQKGFNQALSEQVQKVRAKVTQAWRELFQNSEVS